MTKLLMLIPLLLIINGPAGEPVDKSPVQVNDLLAIAQGADSEQLYAGYDYWFLGGVSIEVHIFGDGKAYYHKSVHSKEYQDALREADRHGKRTTPYQWSLAMCEYGDYEVFRYAELSPDQVRQIAQVIADSNALDDENKLGDSQYHSLKVALPGKETVKTVTVLNSSMDFINIADFFTDDIKNMVSFQDCTKVDYDQAMNASVESLSRRAMR